MSAHRTQPNSVDRIRYLVAELRKLQDIIDSQADRILDLEAELTSCRECRAKIDCLSRGAVLDPVRDEGAERIRELEGALEEVIRIDRLNVFVDWVLIEDKDGMCARLARAALQPKQSAK